MDDPEIEPGVHNAALRGLARLNRASGIVRTVSRELGRIAGRDRIRVLDVAAGSGDLVVALARHARRADLPWTFAACDISPTACVAIRERAEAAGVGVDVRQVDALAEPLPPGHDVVMCHLFLHHLSENEIAKVLSRMRAAASRSILVTDLKRSRAGYALAFAASRLLTRSPIVHTDALRSVEGALTTVELSACARQAGFPDPRIRTAWPERMILRWDA